MIVTIEGNIGSGKSTLIEYLKNQDTPFVFIKEPVDIWEQFREDETGESILEKFYADQYKYAFSFQILALHTRIELLKSVCKSHPNKIIVTERSLFTDKYVFAEMLKNSGAIESINYKIYCTLFDSFVSEFTVSKVIYICTQPDVCLERIARRARLGEDKIDLSYLSMCHEYHEEMISGFSCEILRINGNQELHDPSSPAGLLQLQTICKSILEFTCPNFL